MRSEVTGGGSGSVLSKNEDTAGAGKGQYHKGPETGLYRLPCVEIGEAIRRSRPGIL